MPHGNCSLTERSRLCLHPTDNRDDHGGAPCPHEKGVPSPGEGKSRFCKYSIPCQDCEHSNVFTFFHSLLLQGGASQGILSWTEVLLLRLLLG